MKRERTVIAVLCGLAFMLRITVAAWGADHFWSYPTYFQVATHVADGRGYCLADDGGYCAYFPPVYPTVVAVGILTGHPRIAIVLISSAIGAGTVWLTFLIGRLLFGSPTGLLAAACVAVYPYFVWHDPVVQENATLAFVVAGTMLLLIRSNASASRWVWLCTGAMLALAVLTKANLGLFIPFALAWMAIAAPDPLLRWRRVTWAGLGVLLVLGPWLVRTWRVAGEPILYSNAGFSLWTANHKLTFDYFPERSIDDASGPQWDDLSAEERHEFDAIVDRQGIQQTHWLWRKGMAFIEANPGLTLKRAVYKVWIAFSPRFSPAKGWLFQSVYLVSYFPLFLLTGVGAWKARAQWREAGYFYVLMASFALGSAVFWAHTSHRMYLEPYLMILSAHAVADSRLIRRLLPAC